MLISDMHEACQNTVYVYSALSLSDHQLSIRGGSVETARKKHVVQVFHTRTEPYIFAGFNHAQNVQIYIVYRDHPSFKQSIICI